MFGVVDGVVQAATLLAFEGLAGDEVADVDHVAEFADVLCRLDALEQVFGLFVEQVQTFPGSVQAQVAAHNADVGGHDLSDFFHVLCDEHLLFVRHCSFVVPFGHCVVELVLVDDAERVTGGCVGIDNGFDERVRGQAVAAVQTGAGAFAHGVESVDAALSVEVNLDAAAHVVGRGHDGDVLLRDVNADGEALGVDVGEVMLGLLGVLVGDVEADVVEGVNLHLVVDGAGDDVARSERESFVVLLHEFLAVGQTQDAAVAAHGLGDEVGGVGLLRVVEHGGVELHEFHVLDFAFGAVYHSDAVAGGDVGVRRGGVDGARASRSHEGDAREIGVHLSRLGVKDVGTEAFDVGCASGHTDAEVVLGDDFDGEVILQNLDVGTTAHGSHESALDFGTRVVGVVQDAEFGVSAFAVQVELSVGVLVEVDAPLDEFLNLCRGIAHHLFHGFAVADVVARNHCVLNVLFKVIDQQVGDAGDAALRFGCVCLLECGLADDGDFPFLCPCHLEGITHAGYTRADDEEVKFTCHDTVYYALQVAKLSHFVRKSARNC